MRECKIKRGERKEKRQVMEHCAESPECQRRGGNVGQGGEMQRVVMFKSSIQL